jgi:hypothetical protein
MTHHDISPASIDALRKVYSITSSAVASSVCGTLRPRAFGGLCAAPNLLHGINPPVMP